MARVLVVQHEDDCPPALLGRWLAEEEIELDVRRPYAGDHLPADLTEHAGLLVLGGPMDADQDGDYAWLAPTRDLLREGAESGVPTLGVCLGHQLLALACGGRVERNPRGRQLGVLDVGWTEAAGGDPLVAELATERRCLHWNQDVVTALPDQAVQLATAPDGEVQAARFGVRAWGIQPHPEADAAVAARWAASDRADDAVNSRGGQVVEQVAACGAELAAAWRPLAASFARLVRQGASA
ncbi:MAG: type 1 glutamine amidotransferase [Nocardioides sp.]